LALAVSALMFMSPVMLFSSSASANPAVGDYFEYDYNTHVYDGRGNYYGYTDTMRSSSKYTVTGIADDVVTVGAIGSWTFEGSDGGYDSGVVDMDFQFLMSTRRYVGATDVEGAYTDPYVWFWVTPNLNKGDILRILDDFFQVTSVDKTIWVGVVPHKVIELTTTGSYTRDDAYGVFSAIYDDTYCFDRESGYLVSEKYVEHDSSEFDGFSYAAEITVTSSSYTTPIDWLTVSIIYILVPAVVILVILLIWKWRRGPSRIKINTVSGETDVEFKPIRRAAEMDSIVPGGSRYFTPFMRVFAKRAVSEGDPVVVATSRNSMIGMAMLDKESRLGSVFALDEPVAKHLIRRLRLRDFFLEVDGRQWEFPPAEQIDAFEVLELKNPEPTPYDNTHVRPMKHEDVVEVVRIAQEVYNGPASTWIRSCFEGGDVGYVADNFGKVVGFGFATVVGANARLHSLTILPNFRASGLGSEIMAARLTVLSALGVQSVIIEISKHNDASMAVARNAGFQKIGETVLFSSRPAKLETIKQRRF
jgi:RimJ/RimL family protein N-acetyltransferase